MKFPWSKKKSPIEFYSLIPEVNTIAPILPARSIRPEMMISATKEYAERKKASDFGTHEESTTAKCPGIFNYTRHGWIQTTWQDIVIETNGDGKTFTWTTPIDQRDMTNGEFIGEMVSFHEADMYADHIGGIPNSIDTIIKINSPWRCKIPKGYYLMSGPVPYSNERRFTPATGFFSPLDQGAATLNVQVFWHVMNGKVLIKAGTPIAHYMLVPEDQGDSVIRAANELDVANERLSSLILFRRYVSDRKERKCLFAKLFTKEK